jgi:hypothetical protein
MLGTYTAGVAFNHLKLLKTCDFGRKFGFPNLQKSVAVSS